MCLLFVESDVAFQPFNCPLIVSSKHVSRCDEPISHVVRKCDKVVDLLCRSSVQFGGLLAILSGDLED